MGFLIEENNYTDATIIENSADFFDEIMSDRVSGAHRAWLHVGDVMFDDAAVDDEVAA
jgi:hypothetical protein